MSDQQQQGDRIAFEVAVGPNTEGHADMAAAAHAQPVADAKKETVDTTPMPAMTGSFVQTEPPIESAMHDESRDGIRDIEPSMPTKEG